MSRSPTLQEVLERVRGAAGADVRVALPAKVVRYDATKRQVDAAPCVKEFYTDEDGARVAEALPVITSVPVCFPSSGGFSVTFPVSVGDYVLLVFSDLSLDKWLATGGVVDPSDDRRHALIDAVAIPGLQDFGHAVDASGASGCIEIGQDGGIFQGVGLGASLKTWLDGHTHASNGATPTPGTPGAGTDTMSPAASASVKVSS